MKSLTLLKQRMINHEKEPPEFTDAKTKVLEMRAILVKVGDALKSFTEGAKSLSTSVGKMNTILAGADQDLEGIALCVLDGLSRNQTEFAVDSIQKKAAWLQELNKKCTTLDTRHLEYSRNKRKHQEASSKNDPVKTQQYEQELNTSKQQYDELYTELFASFQFVIKEATTSSGQATALGLLQQELAAFKSSQLKFFKETGEALGKMPFARAPAPDLSNVWTDFCERRLQAVREATESGTIMSPTNNSSTIQKSGRQLLRQGFSDVPQAVPANNNNNNNNGNNVGGKRPGPPPPPPPPVVANTGRGKPQYRALYAWEPQNSDELQLQVGEIVTLKNEMDDGWMEVTNKYGQTGMVPSNYVEFNDETTL
jgi:hypothetical protein